MTGIGNALAVEAIGNPDSLPGKVARSARMLTEQSTDQAPIIGFVTVAVFGDGCFSMGFHCPEDHPFMGPALFTAYVKEVIERRMTGAMAADDYAKEYLL